VALPYLRDEKTLRLKGRSRMGYREMESTRRKNERMRIHSTFCKKVLIASITNLPTFRNVCDFKAGILSDAFQLRSRIIKCHSSLFTGYGRISWEVRHLCLSMVF
jgi:hypothetical protein